MPDNTALIYFADATLVSAFVTRWCASSKGEMAGGVFRVREHEPAPRVGLVAPDAVTASEIGGLGKPS